MRVVDQPEFPPGCCFLSRTATGPFVDTGLDVDDLDPIGRIYLAESTISDLAQHLGFAPPAASARARERITELEAALTDRDELIAGLMQANEALVAAVDVVPVSAPVVPAGSVPDVLFWVADSDDFDGAVARAALARGAELAEAAPRQELLAELDRSYLLRKGEPHAHQSQSQD